MNALDLAPIQLPPHSIPTEQTVIGILLEQSSAFDLIVDELHEDDFFSHELRTIFRCMAAMHADANAWDAIGVFVALGSPDSDCPCSLPYLMQLVASSPGSARIKRYAGTVRGMSQRRGLMQLGAAMQAEAGCALGCSVAEIIATTDLQLLSISDRTASKAVTISSAMDEAFAYIQMQQEREPGDGITTGLASLDELLGGLEPGQLVIPSARPSVGKTVVAVHLVQRTAARGKSVLLFTLEMTRREIAMRVLAARAEFSTRHMRSPSSEETVPWDRLLAARNAAEGERLFIDDRSAVTIGYIRAKARRIKRQHGLDLVVIDYLGLVKGIGENRVQEIGSISRGLKALAKELEVPIVALAQLNRNVEGRVDKRPLLSDLRDSGDIEQDADVVLMLHRESAYSADPQWAGVMEILVRKNRHGPIGDALVTFNDETGSLSNHLGQNPRASMLPRRVKPRGLN